MEPFLKWAGGKRWLFNAELVESLPKFDRYVEPFLGGGAGFFALEPTCALITDINPELINLYEQIRDNPAGLAALLAKYQALHNREKYYETRAQKFSRDLQGAARTLYLNRTCWNGLYRLNLKSEFNVPIGTKSRIVSSTDNFFEASHLLQRALILVSDFEDTMEMCGKGDLIFVDPPYTVKHNLNGFVKYNESIFSWDDQVRLKDAIVRSLDRGAKVMLTNADHSSVHDLYEGIGTVTSVARNSVISGKAFGRSRITELLLVA